MKTSQLANNAPYGIQLPVQLHQERGNLWTWRFNGIQMRNHFASGYWFSQDGLNAFQAWQDLQNHTLTSVKAVEILSDASGRQYVEVNKKGKTWKQYVDEAVCACFHGRLTNPNDRPHHIDGDISNNAADNLMWGE